MVTLVVYWAAEVYAELLGEHVARAAAGLGVYPGYAGGPVADGQRLLYPAAGADAGPGGRCLGRAAANAGLAAAVVLLVFHGWSVGRASKLRGRQLLIVTSIAAGLGLVMVMLKDLVPVHLH